MISILVNGCRQEQNLSQYYFYLLSSNTHVPFCSYVFDLQETHWSKYKGKQLYKSVYLVIAITLVKLI